MLLPLNELQGEIRGLTRRNILRQQLRSGKMNMPSISSTLKDTGAIDFSLEETDEENVEERDNCGKETSTGNECNKPSKVSSNKGNQEIDVAIEHIHEPPNEGRETSV